MVLVPGEVFAGYTIEALLGRGGMGEVYRARHPRLPRQVAVKVLTDIAAQDSSFRLRFDREADLAARTNHRNIVTVYDRGVEAGRPWICMEYVPGIDVSALLRRHGGGLPVAQALHIVTEAAAGIDHAHRHGLLHRDIKPANILLAPGDPGEGDRVLVSDFGIARSINESTGLTTTGAFVATLAYAAPETFTDDPVTPATDIYALGATLFEMLTGTVPFPRANPAAVMHAHLYDPIPTITGLRRELPPALDAVLDRALAKNPALRFATARELSRATAAAVHATQVSEPPRQRRPAEPPTPPRRSAPHAGSPPVPGAPESQPFPRPASASGVHPAAGQQTASGTASGPSSPPPGVPVQPSPEAAPPVPPPRPQASRVGMGAAQPGAAATPNRSAAGAPRAAARAKRRLLERLPPGGRRWPVLLAMALVVGGGAIAYEYHRAGSDYYVGSSNGKVVVFHGSPGSVLGLFTVRDVDQVACVTRAGELTLAGPGAGFPSGCLQLRLSDLRASGRDSVSRGLSASSRDTAIQQLRSLVQTELLPPCEKAGTQSTLTTTPVVPTAPQLGSPPTTTPDANPGQNCRTAD